MNKITLGTFDCKEADIQNVCAALKSNYLSTGPELRQFEHEVAEYHGKRHGVMVNSGQSALEVALAYAKHDGMNNQVIVPTTTYAATLWAIVNMGFEPIFCDIDIDYNIDYDAILKDKNKYGSASTIMTVDLCGKAATPPQEILDRYFVIEDACEAFGNKKCHYGDIVCFSFYVSHIITTGSGGMVCHNYTEDKDWFESYISHGRTFGGDFTKNEDKWVDKFSFDKVGVSCRSNNLLGALGLSQMSRLEDMIAIRKQNSLHLIDKFGEDALLRNYFIFPSREYWRDCVFQFFPIMIRRERPGGQYPIINRKLVLSHLYSEGIDSRVLLSLTNQPIFKEKFGDIEKDFHNSSYCNNGGFIVGCHHNLSTEDMDRIVNSLVSLIKKIR